MENKGFIARIMIMLKLRRVLVILQKLNNKKVYPSMGRFFLYLGGIEWPDNKTPWSVMWFRLNNVIEYKYRYQYFKENLETIIKDNLGENPDKHFIGYHEDYYGVGNREGLAVTARGRKLIKKLGFIQIIGGEFSIIWALIGWVVTIILTMIGTYLMIK